jgi:hypothetical protein
MNIIFGNDQVTELSKKYTVLELDTIQFGENGPVATAYCTIENIPLSELHILEDTKNQHKHLMINYRLRAWEKCIDGINQLTGHFGGELDTFYKELHNRITQYLDQDPGADWSPVIRR